jgi:hypothetical protein
MPDAGRTTTDPDVGGAPAPAERYAACFAMVSFLICSVIGPLGVLVWARGGRSPFARRWAIVSLALEVPVLVGTAVVVLVAVTAGDAATAWAFIGAWLLQAALTVYALILGVHAWRGRDVADLPLPAVLRRVAR